MVDPEPASSEGYNAFEQHLEQLITNTAHLSEWERLDPLMREAATAPHPYWCTRTPPYACRI